MMPSTLVRAKPRGPISFIGHIAAALERGDGGVATTTTRPKCVAYLDDGRRCDLPARYVDFKLGGHVCFEHRPGKRELVALT